MPPLSQDDVYRQQLAELFAWADHEGLSNQMIARAYGVADAAYIAQVRKNTKPRRKFLKWFLEYRQAYLPSDVTAGSQWGSYNRHAHLMIEGRYQLIRRAPPSPDQITATDFSIAWSSRHHCLSYTQADQPGPKFMWQVEGNIAFLKDYATYHFVATDNALGRHQMMSAKYHPLRKSFRALSIMLPLHTQPIALPVVLIRWDKSHQLNETIPPTHAVYPEYNHLLEETLDFDPATLFLQIRPYR